MESKINYTLVGVVVMILITGFIAFVFWLGKHGSIQDYNDYHVYMSESVAGLSADSSVKYRGVDVGTVKQIGLNPENSEQVELVLTIKNMAPIKTDTTATLKSFGLTGLVYIELEGGSQNAALLEKNEKGFFVIQAKPSTMARFTESVGLLTEQLSVTLVKVDRLLSDDNLQNVETILLETRQLTQEIREQLQGIKQVVDGGVAMEKRISNAFDRVATASSSIKQMAKSLEKNSAEVGRSVSQDVKQSLESFNQLLYELDILAGDLQSTAKAIEESPSDLLFKRTQPTPGPGEEGYREP